MGAVDEATAIATVHRPPAQMWRTFLANHRAAISAADLLTVQTLTF